MSLTNQEKVDTRRFCGYGAFGGIASPAFGARFFRAYGTLEFKLGNLAAEEESTLRLIYLASVNSLFVLEAALYATSANLDTDVAAVWTHNKNEQRDRERLFNRMRCNLCAFLGVEQGPDLSNAVGITFIV